MDAYFIGRERETRERIDDGQEEVQTRNNGDNQPNEEE